ncbi:Rho/Rac GTPase guanine nucleotide exchange factor smgGDS/Vimar [Ceraceosorus bombacis]|uniref:Rho/Rac GTPase guanine nucleotide exchange factor smgGDS/Vimar n=1 Tax=Ceraceosorus bombacis TaxID=401625 RepID=A0A0P1BM17_9BASI|nr:Rho/Rac GTPase guanine nucleotide exchange factor smgGDS/Vimar [Ceraceosorus bombacis]
MALAPHMEVISGLCAAHGLQHDSGVDFGGSGAEKSWQGRPQQAVHASGSSSAPLLSDGKPKLNIASSSASSVAASPLVMSPAPRNDHDDEADAWDEVARTLKPIGDTLRGDRLRTPLGSSDLPSSVVHILRVARRQSVLANDRTSASEADAVTECLRIVANLCIDHADNRARFLDVGGVQAVISTLDGILSSPIPTDPSALQFSPTSLKLLRTSAGALLNLALEHPGVHQALRSEHHLSTLAKLASWPRLYVPSAWSAERVHFDRAARSAARGEEDMQRIRDAASTAGWGWRVLCDVCADQEEPGEAEEADKDQKEAEAESEADHPVELLCRSEGFNALFRPLVAMLVAQRPSAQGTVLPWTDDDVSDLISSDSDILTLAAELLETAGRRSSTFRSRSMHAINLDAHSARLLSDLPALPTPLALLMHFLDVSTSPPSWEGQGVPAASDAEALSEAKKTYSLSKASVARAIVAISGEDENMDKLFAGGMHNDRKEGWFLGTCADWMGRRNREDLAGTALLALGNLARKDANCIALVKHSALLPTLVSHLQTAEPDIKVIYGCVGLLKNLSIPAPNKSLLGDAGLLELVAPFLDAKYDNVQPLQFATVGLLKHLCAGGQIQNALRLVLGKSNGRMPLGILLSVLGRTEDVPTRMEGTRILVNAIKTLWQAQTSGDATSDSKRAEAKSLLLGNEAVVTALSEMVRASHKYPVLVNEGIFALTLLSTEPAGAIAVAEAMLRIGEVPSRKDSGQSASASISDLSASEAGTSSAAAPADAHTQHPQRQDTLQAYRKKSSSASSSTASPPRSIDMVYSVLARRDARMPPAFAANACSLLEAIAEQAQAGRQRDLMEKISRELLPALRHLNEQGPSEVMPQAAATLRAVQRAQEQ